MPKTGVSAPALLFSKSSHQPSSSKGAPVFPRESIKSTSNPCLFPAKVKLSTSMGLGLPQRACETPSPWPEEQETFTSASLDHLLVEGWRRSPSATKPHLPWQLDFLSPLRRDNPPKKAPWIWFHGNICFEEHESAIHCCQNTPRLPWLYRVHVK